MAVQPQPKAAPSTAGSAVTPRDNTSASAEADESNMVIVDLGKQNRSRIKKLKKGRGKLMGKIESIVSDLNEEDVIPADASVVVVIVKEKPSMGSIFDS